MTLEVAKQRADYKFTLNGIENLIGDIWNNYMQNLFENGNGYMGVAILEIGYVDVEVNIYTEEQVARSNDQAGNKAPVIDYFACLKHGSGDDEWESDGYLDYSLNVDWNAVDWKEQLEKDMFNALNRYVAEHGYHYDQPN